MQSNRDDIIEARKQVDNMNPPQETFSLVIGDMFCYTMLADKNEGTVYRNLTGTFPVQLFEVHLYIFVCYIYSANTIVMCPIKDRTDTCMVLTFKDVYE